eukprot:690448-Amphidinium_carterae.1
MGSLHTCTSILAFSTAREYAHADSLDIKLCGDSKEASVLCERPVAKRVQSTTNLWSLQGQRAVSLGRGPSQEWQHQPSTQRMLLSPTRAQPLQTFERAWNAHDFASVSIWEMATNLWMSLVSSCAGFCYVCFLGVKGVRELKPQVTCNIKMRRDVS